MAQSLSMFKLEEIKDPELRERCSQYLLVIPDVDKIAMSQPHSYRGDLRRYIRVGKYHPDPQNVQTYHEVYFHLARTNSNKAQDKAPNGMISFVDDSRLPSDIKPENLNLEHPFNLIRGEINLITKKKQISMLGRFLLFVYDPATFDYIWPLSSVSDNFRAIMEKIRKPSHDIRDTERTAKCLPARVHAYDFAQDSSDPNPKDCFHEDTKSLPAQPLTNQTPDKGFHTAASAASAFSQQRLHVPISTSMNSTTAATVHAEPQPITPKTNDEADESTETVAAWADDTKKRKAAFAQSRKELEDQVALQAEQLLTAEEKLKLERELRKILERQAAAHEKELKQAKEETRAAQEKIRAPQDETRAAKEETRAAREETRTVQEETRATKKDFNNRDAVRQELLRKARIETDSVRDELEKSQAKVTQLERSAKHFRSEVFKYMDEAVDLRAQLESLQGRSM